MNRISPFCFVRLPLTILVVSLLALGCSMRGAWGQASGGDSSTTTDATAADTSDAATPAPTPPPPDDEFDEPIVVYTGVGYIDPAPLANRIRFRYDGAFHNVQPARAEFFWPVNGPFGPGPGPETSVDYQDFKLYLEGLLAPRWSVFGEMPFRLINPDLQANTGGLSDINAGVRFALRETCDTAGTLQLKVYIPSGDGERGLGSGHASIEPALLYLQQITPRIQLEAELRDWIALGGSPGFAGNVLRYGLGASVLLGDGDNYDLATPPLSAVLEFVGWTVLSGGTAITSSPTSTIFRDAAGDTIVNAKAGVRVPVTELSSLYVGYGRALTNMTWYDDVVRVEWRMSF